MTAIVVGIGQLAAGDDAIGLLVARTLAARGHLVREAADASVVLELVQAGRRVVIVDAVVGGGPPGAVLQLGAGDLATVAAPLSSHGLAVADAILIARELYRAGDDAIRLIGIAIDPPVRGVIGLSPAVAAALEPAAALAAELAGLVSAGSSSPP